jgi:hypothetical protein
VAVAVDPAGEGREQELEVEHGTVAISESASGCALPP